ncbi:hypothetical protein [Pyrobaculum aerophilum]|uniref:PIN domain-containing protein n=1 Tax=Pyrobaculum aerophilum TaxID=13773 RepID=A0A371R118_9CREN|nr:hypothetical protein [Pyrobaculum aerophilum]RFA97162.1 hypothetical protein CGL51_03770 [Pyrobaculum aerophilum]RFB00061.1 hypothetical protein CGL52_02590 [Pyrobaculum aerophilum]
MDIYKGVDAGILTARILLQGALPQAIELGEDAGIESEVWNCILLAVSTTRLYTASFAVAEALQGIMAQRWPHVYTHALAAVQLNSSGGRSGDIQPPAPLNLVSMSLVEAARQTGLPLVTCDVELWQYARGLIDVMYVHELCV